MRASGIIATTFTKKAAAELQERVRVRLLEDGLSQAANDLGNALIGTVHGLGVKLLKRFAFEAGVSPETDIISDDDQQAMFNRSLSTVLSNERVSEMENLAERLGFAKSPYNTTDWRRLLKNLTEVIRSNNLPKAVIEKSKVQSWEGFRQFLEEKTERTDGEWNQLLTGHLENTITALDNNEDSTKKTADAVKSLREILAELKIRGEMFWHQWVKIAKIGVGAKSRDDISELVAFANSHLSHAGLHNDLKSFIFRVFELAGESIEEFDRFKKSRGLIDYTDMEVLVNGLLDLPVVQEVMAEELDLLMVDEFQDTSPLQLEIFLKLSKFAKHSIWVGDPKQSIYGFRGAEPALMLAIIELQGGLKAENILQYSWRSREDVVNATNAIFTQAFSTLPPEQVALRPKRCKKAHADSANKTDEPPEMELALHHWNFSYDGEGRKPGRAWLNDCVATQVAKMLERGLVILPKGENKYRPARPGDVAILCRSNKECQVMAEALHRAGLRAAISRAGLLGTAESRLILACLKFVLNRYDSLSVAEILRLGARLEIEEIIEGRLDYLQKDPTERTLRWAFDQPLVQRLNDLRGQVVELSSAEILTLILEELDLRRIIIAWGNVEQRLANVGELTRLSLQYEEACNRLHTAASLGGFLLWLNDLENDGLDMQGSGENPQAVNVLTYHKSKGLEYPILVCHSLEGQLRDDVWGIELISERSDVDLDDLLGGRWVRLWANPYADQYRNTVLAERIAESEASAAKRKQALEEEARLLYVGITRARDYLIFPTYHKPPTWLNRVCGNGDEKRPALDASSNLTPWEWDGMPLKIQTEVIPHAADFGHADVPLEPILALPKSPGKAEHSPLAFDFSNEKAALEIRSELNYASPLNLPEVMERRQVGLALKGFLMADDVSAPNEERAELADGLRHRFEVEELVASEVFLMTGEGFRQWLSAEFPEGEAIHNYPLRAYIDGHLFEANLDLLVKKANSTALVFLSPFVGNAKSRGKFLRDSVGYFTACKNALGAEGDVQLFVNFVLEGLVVEIG